MNSQNERSLLDSISDDMHCMYLSDLKYADKVSGKRIAALITNSYPASSASLYEWNDALNYLTGNDGLFTAEETREKLILLLQEKS